jgi:hypothetical protein
MRKAPEQAQNSQPQHGDTQRFMRVNRQALTLVGQKIHNPN